MMTRNVRRETLKVRGEEFTLAAAGGFGEVLVEQLIAGSRVVASEMGRSMQIRDAFGGIDRFSS